MIEGYKKTNIGYIPEDWGLTKLSMISDFSNGKGHEKNIVEDGSFIVVNSKFISTEGKVRKFSDKCLSPLMKNDIAIVMSDIPNGKAIAKCFLVDEDHTYTLNQRVGSIKAHDNVDTRFLFTVLNRNRYYLAFDNGVSQTNLKKDEVINCPIQLPPLPEQKKIADIERTLDEKIKVIDQQISETENLKTGLMQRLLTQGLGHTEFKDSPLGKIPKSWEIKTLKSIGGFYKGKGITKSEITEDGTIPCVRYGEIYTNYSSVIKEIHSYINPISAANSNRFYQGDLLFTGSGEKVEDIGKCTTYMGDEEPYASGDIIILRPKDGNSAYLSYCMGSSLIRGQLMKLGQGNSVVHIYASHLESVIVPFPPKQEQIKISEIFNLIDEKLEMLAQKKSIIEDLKKGLMQQLLTGRVRITNPVEA